MVRNSIIELADIHLKYGFMNEAAAMYRKAFNESSVTQDQYSMAYVMTMVSYFGKIDEQLEEYS